MAIIVAYRNIFETVGIRSGNTTGAFRPKDVLRSESTQRLAQRPYTSIDLKTQKDSRLSSLRLRDTTYSATMALADRAGLTDSRQTYVSYVLMRAPRGPYVGIPRN